jgi:acetoin utilization deacetylase AcuC-like enzyme
MHMTHTGLLLDRSYARHVVEAEHPERPARVQAVWDSLHESGLAQRCRRIDPAAASEDLIEAVHSSEYLGRFKQACLLGQSFLDWSECSICKDTFEVARLACGGVLRAVDQVLRSEIANAFCVVRPPGHHAEREQAMGFCFINNIAVAARYLLEVCGLRRVLILDWDVHHGNGTYRAFEEEARVFFCSLHGHPDYLFPGTGYAGERGKGAGEGFSLNIPLLPGTGDSEYRSAFETEFLAAAERFAPEFVLISAGFDPHRSDPLSILKVETDTFAWMTDRVCALARRSCSGRVVSVLEGGYNLDVLGQCCGAHLKALLEAGAALE